MSRSFLFNASRGPTRIIKIPTATAGAFAFLFLLSSCVDEAEGGESDGKADTFDSFDECVAAVRSIPIGPAQDVLGYQIAVNGFLGGATTTSALIGDREGVEVRAPVAETGKPLEIIYFGGLNDRPDLGAIRLGFKIDGQDTLIPMATEPFDSRSFSRAEIELPQGAREARFWFQADRNDETGPEFDSRDGQDYAVEVLPEPRGSLCFDRGFGRHREGAVAPGSSVQVFYDYRRLLDQIRDQLQFFQFWRVSAFARVLGADGREISVVEVPLTRGVLFAGEDIFAIQHLTPLLPIPPAATGLQIWFFAEVSGHHFWDSNHGDDWHFEVDR
jgi:hypothetical protein